RDVAALGRRRRRAHGVVRDARRAARADPSRAQPRHLRARRAAGRALDGRSRARSLLDARRAGHCLMQIVRFRAGDATRYGVLDGASVLEYSGTPWTVFRRGRKRHSLHQVVLLAPVAPSKIVAVGLNYRAPAAGLAGPRPDLPVLALELRSAVIGPDDPIVLPPQSEFVEHEAELAVVMRRRCHKVAATRAREFVLGYTALNDVTARDVRAREGLSTTRAKGFDTFCPLGPCIATDVDPSALSVEGLVNGVVRQVGSTKDLVFPVEDLVARVSEVMTLMPGDVISTGTPAGASRLLPGDRVEVRVEGIGSLRNPVVKLGRRIACGSRTSVSTVTTACPPPSGPSACGSRSTPSSPWI